MESGQVRWAGQDISNMPAHLRRFGLMFQDYALFPHLNVVRNVAFGLEMLNLKEDAIQANVQDALDLVGLRGFEERDVNGLSGGEQQRVALARSLAPRPRLLMLDEPLGSLDRALRERLLADLQRILARTKQTAIYVTHDQEEAYAVAGRIVVMDAGRAVQVGAPEEIYRRPASVFVARFLGLTNLFRGEVVDGRLVTAVGDLPFDDDIKGEVTVLLRPDAATLDGQAGLWLRGVVREKSFRGGAQRVRVRLRGEELAFDFPGNAGLPGVDEEIALGFDPQTAIQVFAE
jgi:ABC-type Fe3+/spermidine/putrescine transport system ATPase subunit